MKYLTRPDVSKIEIPTPAPKAPVEPQEMSSEEHAAHLNAQLNEGYATGGRVNYAKGTPFNYNALSNAERVKAGRERVIKFVENFKKENGRLPSQQEVRKLGNFNFDTVKNAIESGSVEVLPLNQTKGEFTKIPVHNDLRTLDQSKVIRDAFKSGELPTLEDIQKVLKIDDPTTAKARITQLADVYTGKGKVEGIKPKFQKTAQNILDNNTYDYQIRNIHEKDVAQSVGERRTPASVRTTIQRDLIPNVKGYSIDEPAGITSSVRNKTTPYGIFSQIIDTDINKGDKFTFDSIKSKKEDVLQNAIKSEDKTKINQALKDYNKAISKYENILNKDVEPGEKKIRLFKASLNSPENTIKNFDNLPEKYQEAFTKNFNERGFSYEVPKDIKDIWEIGRDLKDPKIAEKVAERAAQGQSRIYSFPANLSEAPLLSRAGSLAKGYWNVIGGEAAPVFGAVLNSGEMQEKGLGEGEAAVYGAIKGTLQDPLNFLIGVGKAVGSRILPAPVRELISDGEEKPFFETALGDKTVDISNVPYIGSNWYANQKSDKEKIDNLLQLNLRKQLAEKNISSNPYGVMSDIGTVEGAQDNYITQEQKDQIINNARKNLLKDFELNKKYNEQQPTTGFEFKTGGRVGYKDGSDDKIDIPTLSNQETPMSEVYNAKNEEGIISLATGGIIWKK
jgi:hypothetical protein